MATVDAESRWSLTAAGEAAATRAQLAALTAALAAVAARVARLDAHASEVAGEVLALLERVDRLDTRLADGLRRAEADVREHEWRQHR